MPLVLVNPPAGTKSGDDQESESRAPELIQAPAPLRLWHLCSLDAPTVAVVWALGFAWAARVRLPIFLLVSIALVVWAAYVADRLLDAYRATRSGRLGTLRERHFFHWRHRRILMPLGTAAALAAGGLVLAFMPEIARERGLVLAAGASAYFLRIHGGDRRAKPTARPVSPFVGPAYWPVSKELLVGLLFTVGCILPAWNRAHSWYALVPAAVFAPLAWLNCSAIDGWEAGWEASRVSSTSFFGYLLAATGVLLAISVAPWNLREAALIVSGAVSAVLLAQLNRARERMTPIALRAAADLVLLTPLVLLLN